MAKTYQIEMLSYSQAELDKFAHSVMFASNVTPVYLGGAGSPDAHSLVVTSNVESENPGTNSGSNYRVLADDSQSEIAIDIATGKFVEGNVITGIAPLSEIQSDVRDFVTYEIAGTDLKFFAGVCSTTQSQDYTPDIVANSRATKMLTPAQVKSLNL